MHIVYANAMPLCIRDLKCLHTIMLVEVPYPILRGNYRLKMLDSINYLLEFSERCHYLI